MAVYLGSEVTVKATGRSCTVPNNPRAQLMYYLDCMCNVIDLGAARELRDYNNYFRLDDSQEEAVIAFCLLLNPTVLMGKCIFPVERNNPRLNGSGNEFLSIESNTTTFAATNTVVLGGKVRSVKKLMIFTEGWMDRNYIEPLKSFVSRNYVASGAKH